MPISQFNIWRRHLLRFPFEVNYKEPPKVESGVVTASIRDEI